MAEEWWVGFFDAWYLKTYPHDEAAALKQAEFAIEAMGLEPGASVLDLCCGYGRHSVILAEQGMRVTGLDRSEVLLARAGEVAAERGVAVEFRQGDMREVPFADATFGACINLFTAFGYFDAPADNERVLAEVARVLKPGGRFLLDVINRDSLVKRFRPKSWDEVDGALVLHRHHWEADTGQLIEERTIVGDGERREHVVRLHVYTAPQLSRMIERAGLVVERLCGDLTGSEFTLDSRRLVVLAEKPG